MPPDSSGRYQSRFFNFLNRQSLQLTDRFERTVRNIKVAAVWGVQILLYPIYLLVQGSLSVGRQLTAEAEAGWPKLKEFTHQDSEDQEREETQLEADTPIQRVLSDVTILSLPEVSGLVVSQSGGLTGGRSQESGSEIDTTAQGQLTTAFNTELLQDQSSSEDGLTAKQPSNKGYVIQGIASLLATRSLVLVTVDNQILDILTPRQQYKLAAKIRWETADFLHQRRLAQSSKLKQAAPRLSTLDRPRMFLPLRLFWKLMAWIQTSQVAIAANLFQESALVGSEIPNSNQILPSPFAPNPNPELPASNDQAIANQLVPQKAIVVLDRTIADLESHQLVPGTEALVKLRDSFRDRWQTIVHNLAPTSKSSPPSSQDSEAATESSQARSSQIQALIYAAIEYFFGRRSADLSGTDSQERLPQRGSAKRSQIPGIRQGERERLSGRQSPTLSPAQSSKNSQLSDAGELDSWLSWDDLFGNSDSPDSISYNDAISQELESQNPNLKSQAQLPETFGSKIPKPRNSIWNTLKRFVSPDKAADELVVPSPKTPKGKRTLPYTPRGELTTTQKAPPLATQPEDKGSTLTEQSKMPSSVEVASQTPESILPATTESTAIASTDAPSAIAIPSTPSQSTDLEPAPDWIETRVTPTGYVKHPLEQILEWLDRSILRLEELALKVWRWLRHLGR